MIVDRLENAHLYQELHPRFAQAFDYLRGVALDALPAGKQTIDGERLFALVNDYQTQPLAECRFESHRRYADIQLLVRGVERIGVVQLPSEALTITEPYVVERDIGFYSGLGDLITLHAGTFTLFFPHDAHQPGVAFDSPLAVRKVVMKVELE